MKQHYYTALFTAFFFIALTGCEKKGTGSSFVAAPPVVSSSKKYLALGDSYTIGQSVPVTDRFPVQTKTLLQSLGITIDDPQIIATTGWKTTDLKNAIAAQKPSGPFDVVSLLIGVNDQYQLHDTSGYRERFSDLLYTSIQLAGGKRDHVFVISIPDYSATPYARLSDTVFTRKQIDAFNTINKEVTIQNLCNYLDITPSTKEARNDPDLIAADGLHPSGKEYRKWAERLAPMMKAVL